MLLQLIFLNILQSSIISANFHQIYGNNIFTKTQINNWSKFEGRQNGVPELVAQNGLPNSNLGSGTIFDNQFATALLRFVIYFFMK